MALGIKIVGISILVVTISSLIVKLTYKRAYDIGFRYGYEHNPIINHNTLRLKDSIKLLKGLTLYKKIKRLLIRLSKF